MSKLTKRENEREKETRRGEKRLELSRHRSDAYQIAHYNWNVDVHVRRARVSTGPQPDHSKTCSYIILTES